MTLHGLRTTASIRSLRPVARGPRSRARAYRRRGPARRGAGHAWPRRARASKAPGSVSRKARRRGHRRRAARNRAVVASGAEVEGEPLVLRSDRTYFGTGSDCLYVSWTGRARPAAGHPRRRRGDGRAAGEAPSDRLRHVVAHPSHVPSTLSTPAQFAAMLRGTGKPILMVTPNALTWT